MKFGIRLISTRVAVIGRYSARFRSPYRYIRFRNEIIAFAYSTPPRR